MPEIYAMPVKDYRAHLRWYYGGKNVRFSSDQDALDAFESMLFADECYALETSVALSTEIRAAMFLNEIEQAARAATGPAADYLRSLIRWCEASPTRLILRKGVSVGEGDGKRYVMGVNSAGEVFEWNPKWKRLTVISGDNFMRDVVWTQYANQVYKSTAGMLPIIAIVTFGGIAVVGLATFGGAIVLQALSRNLIRKLALAETGQMVAREAVRTAEIHVAAALIEAVLAFVPLDENRVFSFVRGLLRGFGEGAIEHYLSEVDDRFERALKAMPQAALNQVTMGASRWYGVYCKVEKAVIKAAAVADTIEKLALPAFAGILVTTLVGAGQQIVFAILLLLFVALYLDFVIRRGPAQTKPLHDWLKEKGKFGSKLILDSSEAVAEYARSMVRPTTDRTLEELEREEAARKSLAKRLKDVLGDCLKEAPSLGELFTEIFSDTRIKAWEELLSMGFPDLVAHGIDAVDERLRRGGSPGLSNVQAGILGESVGELVGTLFLERRFWNGVNRRPSAKKGAKSSLVPGAYLNKVPQTFFKGGIWRALWQFLKNPVEKNIEQLVPALKHQADPYRRVLHDVVPKEKSYRDFARELLDSEGLMSRRLRNLAADGSILAQLDVLKGSAQRDDIVCPSLEDVLEGKDPLWPREAVLFTAFAWAEMALGEVHDALRSLHDAVPFDGKFDVAQILELLNLDIALDDETVERLKTRVSQVAE